MTVEWLCFCQGKLRRVHILLILVTHHYNVSATEITITVAFVTLKKSRSARLVYRLRSESQDSFTLTIDFF